MTLYFNLLLAPDRNDDYIVDIDDGEDNENWNDDWDEDRDEDRAENRDEDRAEDRIDNTADVRGEDRDVDRAEIELQRNSRYNRSFLSLFFTSSITAEDLVPEVQVQG